MQTPDGLPVPPSEFETPPPSLYETVLRPHRSLAPRGFLILMLVISAVSFVAGMVFVLMGAWPVFGFFGLDVLLLYVAFKASYRDGRTREVLRLTEEDFIVERTNVRGERRRWRFQPFWLRVNLVETGADSNRLLLSSHGNSLAIGGFLTADERRGLAVELRDALLRYRSPA